MSSTATSARRLPATLSASLAIPGQLDLVPLHLEQRPAQCGVLAVVDDHHASPAVLALAGAGTPPGSAGDVHRGSRKTNSLPGRARHFSPRRAPMEFHQPLDERKSNAEAAPARRLAVALGKQFKEVRQLVRRDPDAMSGTATTTSRRHFGVPLMRRHRLGVLGRVVEQVGEHLDSRVRSASSTTGSSGNESQLMPRPSMSGRPVSTAAWTAAAG